MSLLVVIASAVDLASESVLSSRGAKAVYAIFPYVFAVMSFEPDRFENFAQQELLLAFVDAFARMRSR